MSLVWNFFVKSENDATKAKCNLCDKLVSRGGKGKLQTTSNMQKHLSLHHNDEFKAEQEKKKFKESRKRKPLADFFANSFKKSKPLSSDSPGQEEIIQLDKPSTSGHLGEDRKMDICSLTGASFAPGLNENSMGSGEGQGGCDEVSVPLSPEQFLSEDNMDQGVSPSTPSQRPESYKLRHNNHLTLVLESLAGDESFMDVTLTAQGRAIKAHKSILSAVSPYFKSVLKENPCQHPIIIMPRDIRFEELNNIISYVYKGEMTVAAEDLSSLLKTAEILQVTGLSPTDNGGGTGGIISQMQGLPSGLFPNTSSSNSSTTFSTKKTRQSHSQSRPNSKEQQQHNSESHSRIDPLEFLNADMTCVKEEIPSDTEDPDQPLGFSLPKDFAVASSGPIAPEASDVIDPSDRTALTPVPGRRKSLGGSPRPTGDDPTGKPFNPGEPAPCGDNNSSPLSNPASPPMSPHVCPHCLETHRPTDALHSHLRLKHPSKASFVCGCGRVFVRQQHLTEHQKKCKG